MTRVFLTGLAVLLLGLATAVRADESPAAGNRPIPLYEGKPYLHVIHEGRSIKVQRDQDPDYQLRGYFAKTGRQCPPFCLQPEQVADGVETIGERELFDFMETELREQSGLLIDARTPSWHQRGTIPGSVNIPFSQLVKELDDPEMLEVLISFGLKPRKEVGMVARQLEKWDLVETRYLTEKWDFSECKNLVLWCNGPLCGQSPAAIRGLLAAGYPADKIRYYRGGMQMWQLFGLTTVVPKGAKN